MPCGNCNKARAAFVHQQKEIQILQNQMFGQGSKAIIVTGLESSGTKYFCKILRQMGVDIDTGDQQKWDAMTPNVKDNPYAGIRRSIPHGGRIELINQIWRFYKIYGTDLIVFNIVRSYYPCYRSSVDKKHAQNEDQKRRETQDYFAELSKIPSFVKVYNVTYESLGDKNIMDWLYRTIFMIDMPPEVKIEPFTNQNHKY